MLWLGMSVMFARNISTHANHKIMTNFLVTQKVKIRDYLRENYQFHNHRQITAFLLFTFEDAAHVTRDTY